MSCGRLSSSSWWFFPVRAPVYRGCPCRDPLVCHRVQGDSVAKRQPFCVCVGVLGVVTSCVPCAQRSTCVEGCVYNLFVAHVQKRILTKATMVCVAPRGTDDPHWRRQAAEADELHADFKFTGRGDSDKQTNGTPTSEWQIQCFMWCNLFICGIVLSTRHSQTWNSCGKYC